MVDLLEVFGSSSAVEFAIREYILSEKDRYILMRKLLDKVTFEKIAEELKMSDRQIKTRFKNAKEILLQMANKKGTA